MPLYEYECKPCDRKFEQLRPMSMASKRAPCPECAEPAPRALSVFASFTVGGDGDISPIAGGGGGCACATGGGCGCAN